MPNDQARTTSTLGAGSGSAVARRAGPRRDIRGISLLYLSLLALLVGIVTGVGAVLFRDLIGFIHNLLFLGQLSIKKLVDRRTAMGVTTRVFSSPDEAKKWLESCQ